MEFSLEDKILKVSQFNELFDKLVSFQRVIVEGEISQISVSQDKWLFLTVKDENSQIEIFAVACNINTLSLLKEGMLVHVYGTPHIHQKSGRFRITADQIIPVGAGELKIAFELLKQKLEKEGLFAKDRKRIIPQYPEKIALLTAENSQAYHDFIKILKARTGGIQIYFFPIAVQGADSINSIVQTFQLINAKYSYLDFAVLTRGGGSLEDLQAFNSEGVAKAIFSSKIPVVSAIGHEKDVTLSDLVADLRASTPSNAGELVSKNKNELMVDLQFQKTHLGNLVEENVRETEKCSQEAFAIIESGSNKVFRLYELELINLERLLKSLSYENTLKRGFSITFKKDKIIKDIKNIEKGDMIKSQLYKGIIWSKILQ